MATRRSRLSVKPNIGLRGKSGPALSAKKPPNETEKTQDPVVSYQAKVVETPALPVVITEDTSRSLPTKDTISSERIEVANNTKNVTADPPVGKQNSNKSEDVQIESSDKPQEKVTQPRIRSRFPKAKPNVGDSVRPRKRQPSVGQSDTEEDFNKKHPPPVQRVVTVESKSSSNTPSAETNERVPFIPTQPSNNEGSNKALSAISQRRNSKVPEKEELVTKPPPKPKAKKRKMERSDQPPDKSKMTMKDLIYWNPTSNPMKCTDDPKRKRKDPEPEVIEREAVAAAEEPPVEDEVDEPMMAPQLKIGPDGEIILNEESLVVDTSPQKVVENSDTDVVHETESRITSASFRKRTCTKNWSNKDTARFFKALSCVGTDFSMMSNLFPTRSRAELKNKFKKEERSNKAVLDKSLREQIPFDLSTFESESENVEEEEPPSKKKLKKQNKKSKPKVLKQPRKSKGKALYDDSGSDGNGEDDGCRTIAKPDVRADSDDEELEVLSTMHNQPTRSGRVPRRATEYQSPALSQQRTPGRPVSMMINGQPVVSTSITRPPSVVRMPSPAVRPSGQFMALPQQGNAGQITVNQMSPGQLVFVQSNQPGGSQVLHVYVVSPTGVLSRSGAHTPSQQPQLPMPHPAQSSPAQLSAPASPGKTDVVPGQSILKPSPQKMPQQAAAQLPKSLPCNLNVSVSPSHASDDAGQISPPLKDLTARHVWEHMQGDKVTGNAEDEAFSINEELLEAVANEVQREELVSSDS